MKFWIIYRADIEAYEKENRSLLLQLKELTDDLKALKKRYDSEKGKSVR